MTRYGLIFILDLIVLVLLLLTGFMVNGPYSLITTAVSADLGTHSSLASSAKALATVTAIIDGTGSIGKHLILLLTNNLFTQKLTHNNYDIFGLIMMKLYYIIP